MRHEDTQSVAFTHRFLDFDIEEFDRSFECPNFESESLPSSTVGSFWANSRKQVRIQEDDNNISLVANHLSLASHLS